MRTKNVNTTRGDRLELKETPCSAEISFTLSELNVLVEATFHSQGSPMWQARLKPVRDKIHEVWKSLK